MLRLRLYTYLNMLLLNVQFWFWYRHHTMKDFENRLMELGCTKVNGVNSVIFTTPNQKGKIVVTDREILINP